ncbi:hypothetical protein NHX12_032657, partial [Muraenolepis orangiensis]
MNGSHEPQGVLSIPEIYGHQKESKARRMTSLSALHTDRPSPPPVACRTALWRR